MQFIFIYHLTFYRKYSKIESELLNGVMRRFAAFAKKINPERTISLEGMLKRIRVLAAEKGVSVAKVERECGFSKNSIIKWDRNMPSADKILRVAQYFGVTVDYLLGNKDTETSEYPEMYFSFLRGAKQLDLSKKDLDLLLEVARRFKFGDEEK